MAVGTWLAVLVGISTVLGGGLTGMAGLAQRHPVPIIGSAIMIVLGVLILVAVLL